MAFLIVATGLWLIGCLALAASPYDQVTGTDCVRWLARARQRVYALIIAKLGRVNATWTITHTNSAGEVVSERRCENRINTEFNLATPTIAYDYDEAVAEQRHAYLQTVSTPRSLGPNPLEEAWRSRVREVAGVVGVNPNVRPVARVFSNDEHEANRAAIQRGFERLVESIGVPPHFYDQSLGQMHVPPDAPIHPTRAGAESLDAAMIRTMVDEIGDPNAPLPTIRWDTDEPTRQDLEAAMARAFRAVDYMLDPNQPLHPAQQIPPAGISEEVWALATDMWFEREAKPRPGIKITHLGWEVIHEHLPPATPCSPKGFRIPFCTIDVVERLTLAFTQLDLSRALAEAAQSIRAGRMVREEANDYWSQYNYGAQGAPVSQNGENLSMRFDESTSGTVVNEIQGPLPEPTRQVIPYRTPVPPVWVIGQPMRGAGTPYGDMPAAPVQPAVIAIDPAGPGSAFTGVAVVHPDTVLVVGGYEMEITGVDGDTLRVSSRPDGGLTHLRGPRAGLPVSAEELAEWRPDPDGGRDQLVEPDDD